MTALLGITSLQSADIGKAKRCHRLPLGRAHPALFLEPEIEVTLLVREACSSLSTTHTYHAKNLAVYLDDGALCPKRGTLPTILQARQIGSDRGRSGRLWRLRIPVARIWSRRYNARG